jgi:hypothetical protein
MRECFSIYTKSFPHVPSYSLPWTYCKLPSATSYRCKSHLVYIPSEMSNSMAYIHMKQRVLKCIDSDSFAVLLGIYTKQYMRHQPS